jgi:polysaccharide biosynthesis transport protein
MDNNTNEISYYLDIIRRRKFHFLIPMVLTFSVALAVALTLPSIYSSQATVLIEAQNIPEELVRTTITGFVEERLQTLSQIVLSRQNLLDLINRFNPYPELKEKATTEEIVSRMRSDIKMQPVHAQVGGPGGRPSTATIAFNVSYEGVNPQVTAQITNALVSLYLEQNLRVREEKAVTTVLFFQQQMDELHAQVEASEELIARFKEENLYSLPELRQLNQQTLERVKNEINARRQDIQTLTDRKIYLQGQLATIEPVRSVTLPGGRRSMTIEDELTMLRNDYLAQRSVKSDTHPDVIRLKRQIEVLEKETSSRQDLREQQAVLEDKKTRLVSLKQRYSDNHPDVIILTREIEVLEDEVANLASTRTSGSSFRDQVMPDNPTYINLQTQIASTDFEIESVRAKLVELERTLREYERRIERGPAVEQRLSSLQRDYANAQARYQETMSKLQAARESMELEEGQMAEKLTVIEPPQVPESPTRPNRKAIILLGFVLASGFGVGTAAMSEFMDQSVRGPGTLASVAKRPVLGVIPRLRTSRDKRKFWLTRILAVLIFLALAAGVLYYIHNYYQPLDILWLRVLERF